MEKIHHKAWPTKTYHPMKHTPPHTYSQNNSKAPKFLKGMVKSWFSLKACNELQNKERGT